MNETDLILWNCNSYVRPDLKGLQIEDNQKNDSFMTVVFFNLHGFFKKN